MLLNIFRWILDFPGGRSKIKEFVSGKPLVPYVAHGSVTVLSWDYGSVTVSVTVPYVAHGRKGFAFPGVVGPVKSPSGTLRSLWKKVSDLDRTHFGSLLGEKGYVP